MRLDAPLLHRVIAEHVPDNHTRMQLQRVTAIDILSVSSADDFSSALRDFADHADVQMRAKIISAYEKQIRAQDDGAT